MNISEKIEAIRRQPEHIRLRYVWACVAASMLIVALVWLFSIASMFTEENKSPEQTNANIQDLGQQLQTLKEKSASLKDIGSRALDAGSNNATAPANTNGFQYPAATSISNMPQSGTYAKLPGADPANQ